jgi:hypothetical protein
MVAMARGSEECPGVEMSEDLRLFVLAGVEVTLGERIGGWVEEPAIGEVEGEMEGREGCQGEPRLGFPLMRSLMCAGWLGIARGASSQSCR